MALLRVDSGTDRLQGAADRAGAGDVIELQAGLHRVTRPVVLRRGGAAGAPLVIRGREGALIRGDRRPDPNDFSPPAPGSNRNARLPVGGDWCFLRMRGVEHVTLAQLDIADCWPLVVYAENVRHLTFAGNRVAGGTFALFVRDHVPLDRSHDILVEHNHWQQDTSPGHDLWRSIDWREAHGQEDGQGTRRYFAGALLGSANIGGRVFFRHNTVTDAFNGMVAWVTRGLHEPRFEAELLARNVGLFIHDNDFIRVRDNPIEPEGHARNLHARHNRFVDCHAWFSLERVRGGPWYIYGNRGWFTERQGGPVNTRGKVLKFEELGDKPYLRTAAPTYVFNNSWYLRCPLIAGTDDLLVSSKRLKFFNNASIFCRPEDHGPGPDGTNPCSDAGYIESFDWESPKLAFDRNFSNHPDFPELLREFGQEPTGEHLDGPVFEDARSGDFRPLPGSPILGAGREVLIEAPDGSYFTFPAGSNAGAWQRHGLISVPELERETENGSRS